MSASAKNIYQYGSTGIAVPSTISGQNVNQSCLAWKTFSPIILSSSTSTQLPNCPCMNVKLCNQLGNDQIAVGGLPGSNDDPYFFPNNPGIARGTVVPPGQCHIFKVTNSNLLTVIALRDGDIISMQACLSQSDFMTPTADPGSNPIATYPIPMVVTVTPADNSISGLSTVVAVMNTPVSGVNASNVFLKQHSNGVTVPSTVSLAGDNITITLTPVSLSIKTQYDFTIQNLQNLQNMTQFPNPFNSTFTEALLNVKAISEGPFSISQVIKKKAIKPIAQLALSVSESAAIHRIKAKTIADTSSGAVTETGKKKAIKFVNESIAVSESVGVVHTHGYNVAQSGSSFTSFFDDSLTEIGYGEAASVANSLVGRAITSITFTAKTQNHNAIGSVGQIDIVKANGTLQYIFNTNFTVTNDTSPHSITVTDAGNTYVMTAGDAIVIELDSGGVNSIAVAINTGATYSKGVYFSGAALSSDGSNDLAANIP